MLGFVYLLRLWLCCRLVCKLLPCVGLGWLTACTAFVLLMFGLFICLTCGFCLVLIYITCGMIAPFDRFGFVIWVLVCVAWADGCFDFWV